MSRRLKILLGLGILFGVAILVSVIHHHQLRAATEAYIAQLKAQGEPMDLAQVIPPPVPLEKNASPLIMGALTNFEDRYASIIETNPPPAMREVAPGKAMIGWQQFVIVGFDENVWPLTNNLTTNTWEDLNKELVAAKSDLNIFYNLTNHPAIDFNLDYRNIFSIQPRHLHGLKIAAQWLSAVALYDLHERRTDEACKDTHLILAIVKSQTNERLEISQLVRSALANIAAEITWEILQDPNVSESELSSLQQDWQSVEFIVATKETFLTERVINLNLMNHYLQNPSDLWRGVSGNPDSISYKLCKFRWQGFWAYADEKQMMQLFQVLANATRMAETNHSFLSAQSIVRTNFDRLGFGWPFPSEGTFRMDVDQYSVRWLMSEDAFDSFQLLRRSMDFETTKSMTVAAIALKRYKSRHHEFPEGLDKLTPEILETIPLDYMNGQPLHYHKKSDGTFLLYSVGENGVDDGGKPMMHEWWNFYWSAQKFDLVWPQPATEAEIQNYYAHPPK